MIELGKVQASKHKLQTETRIAVEGEEAQRVLQTQKKLGIKSLADEVTERERATTLSEQQG